MNQLTRHIQLIHSKSGQYKTVLNTNETLYNVVTRVNYLTAILWIEYINKIIKVKNHPNILPIPKINWMYMIKSYRRSLEKRLSEI